MESSLYHMISIGPIALLIALLAAPAYYIHYVYAPPPKKDLPLSRFLLVGIGVGFLAFLVGAAIGIAVACDPVDAGNLCGLVGVFGFGPFFSALAIVGFAHIKTRNARRAA